MIRFLDDTLAKIPFNGSKTTISGGMAGITFAIYALQAFFPFMAGIAEPLIEIFGVLAGAGGFIGAGHKLIK